MPLGKARETHFYGLLFDVKSGKPIMSSEIRKYVVELGLDKVKFLNYPERWLLR